MESPRTDGYNFPEATRQCHDQFQLGSWFFSKNLIFPSPTTSSLRILDVYFPVIPIWNPPLIDPVFPTCC